MKKKFMVIINVTKHGNNFGDLDLRVEAELRAIPSHEVIKTKKFSAQEYEGQHHYAYKQLQQEVKAWAKSMNAIFTGQVA